MQESEKKESVVEKAGTKARCIIVSSRQLLSNKEIMEALQEIDAPDSK